MAEFSSKRQRYGSEIESDHVEENNKRHKSSSSSYNHILSILEEEEEELDHHHHHQPIISDLSSLITTLQQELSSSSSSPPATTTAAVEEEEEEELVVIRHLLEASDDELGIPSSTDGSDDHVEEYDDQYGYGGDGFKIDGCDEHGLSVCGDGLWEFEDANANYYTLLHSQLFM